MIWRSSLVKFLAPHHLRVGHEDDQAMAALHQLVHFGQHCAEPGLGKARMNKMLLSPSRTLPAL